MSRKRSERERKKKRPYRTPTLKTFGDLRALTKGKGGNRTDSGMPKTRNSGSL
jgi:hypothetical protein